MLPSIPLVRRIRQLGIRNGLLGATFTPLFLAPMVWLLIFAYRVEPEEPFTTYPLIAGGVLILGAATAALSVLAYRGFTAWSRPENSSCLRGLKLYGDPVAIVNEIASELRGNTWVAGKSGLTITASWLIYEPSDRYPRFARVEDVVWAYILTVESSEALVSATTCQVKIWDKYGVCMSIEMSMGIGFVGGEISGIDLAEEIIETIAEKAPWIMLGYDEGLDALWKQDQERLILDTNRRKREHQAQETGKSLKSESRQRPPSLMWYIYLHDSVQGPYSEVELSAWLRDGLLNPNTQICREGEEIWQSIAIIGQ